MKRAMWLAFAGALLTGIYLTCGGPAGP